jgi:hypothetical protein
MRLAMRGERDRQRDALAFHQLPEPTYCVCDELAIADQER